METGAGIHRRRARRLALCVALLGLIGASAGFVTPSRAGGGDVCISVHGTKHRDQGSSTCGSSGTGVAVAINDSHVSGLDGVGVGAEELCHLIVGDGGQAIAVNGSTASADGCNAHAVNGGSATCP